MTGKAYALTSVFVLACFGIKSYSVEYEFDRALKKPEQRWGFVWKPEHEKHPEDCLAENNPMDYENNPLAYVQRRYCFDSGSSVGVPSAPSIPAGRKVCRSFTIKRDCVVDLK